MPGRVPAGASDWATLQARDAAAWQAAGSGAGRARQLATFFRQPDVQALAARLHEAGVQGF
jgi:DNA ligase (NAD+)